MSQDTLRSSELLFRSAVNTLKYEVFGESEAETVVLLVLVFVTEVSKECLCEDLII